MDVSCAYASLKNACRTFDETGDHAVAAYIGHAMALLEEKYGIDTDADDYGSSGQMPPPGAVRDGGSHWA